MLGEGVVPAGLLVHWAAWLGATPGEVGHLAAPVSTPRRVAVARRLVAQAARSLLARGIVPTYLHNPGNVASARVAAAAGSEHTYAVGSSRASTSPRRGTAGTAPGRCTHRAAAAVARRSAIGISDPSASAADR